MPPGLAAIGEGSVIAQPRTVLCPHRIEVGAQVTVMEGSHFSLFERHNGREHEPRVRIGDQTVIGPRVWISCVGEVEIGTAVLIGSDVLIADAFHEFTWPGIPVLAQPMRDPVAIRIGDGAFVAPRSCVLSGVEIGAGAVVMPGSVVIADVPARSICAGNPAAVIRRWDAVSEGWVDVAGDWTPVLEALDRAGPVPPPASGD